MKGAFDTVICLNVLEHIKDARTALSNFYGALFTHKGVSSYWFHKAHIYTLFGLGGVGHVKTLYARNFC